jgi:tRNA-modifying protein YgfZ
MAFDSSTASSEYAAARSAAAVFDISDRGQVELAGPDAALFLHNLCTNDIKDLAAGRGCEFFLTTNKARVVGHGFAHRLLPVNPQVVWLDLDPGSAVKVATHLEHYHVTEQVEIADRTNAVAMLHLCGPRAQEILSAVMLEELPELEPLQHIVDRDMRVIRHDRLGLPGFDLVGAGSSAAKWGAELVQGGAEIASSAVFNILRVEAGFPLDGIDFDGERFVVEIGRIKQAICYTKGCYLGQEPIVMARDRGQVNRTLLGLKVEASEPIATAVKVLREGQEVGQVTSSVYSPRLETVIALAYIKRGSQEPGTKVEVLGHQAVVAALPFQGA